MPKNKSRKKMRKTKIEGKKIAPIKLPTKKILHFAFAFALIPVTFIFLKNSPHFRLADIKVIENRAAGRLNAGDILRLYKGRNIFSIDLNSIASRIESEHPAIERVYVKRLLPDTLEIDAVPRIPVATIKSYDYFPVDRTGMVLSPKLKTEGLPAITGLSFWLKVRAGERVESREVEAAFLLLDALSEARFPEGYRVKTINAANHKNLSFYFENGIEAKIGGEDFPERLKMLNTTLARRDLDKRNIKYIDLRFRDVVIGPK